MKRTPWRPGRIGFVAGFAGAFLLGGLAGGNEQPDRIGKPSAPQMGELEEADSILLEISEEVPAVQLPMRAEDFDEESAAEFEAADFEVARVLGNGDPQRLSVLVWLDPALDRPVGRAAEPSRARLGIREFAAQRGAVVQYEYEILPNVINVRGLTPKDVDDLRRMPSVVRVEEDKVYHISLLDSMPLIRGLESQKSAAGLSARGAGVRVCIVDTGINLSHVMFSGRIDTAAGHDFFNNDADESDDHGHGSNVAGIAAGGDGFTVNMGTCGVEPFQGVAPSATIIGVKVCSSGGSCPTSSIVAGINHCASTSLPGGQADVMNISLGGGQFSGFCNSDASAAAANNAVAAGVTVVAAAGNNGFTNALSSPACGSSVIPVGAVYDSNFPNCEDSNSSFTWCLNAFCTSTCTDSAPILADERICFSNRSVNLELTAPGGGIWSAGIASSTSIIEMFGTSQASPHVAGLATLLIGEDPTLTPAEVLQLMRDGAIDLGPAGFDNDFGWGRIDVINSLNLVGPGCTGNPDCDDGLFCNGAETCVSGSCQAGTPPNCNDGIACTTDSCNESTDSCDHTPNNGACSDGLFCNGSEVCNVSTGCQAGTPPNCNDGIACTTDSCNESTDSCDHVPNHGACSDGLFCNGSEVCNVSTGCQAGTPPNCSDGIACTDDSCNEATDSCDHVANNANCDDGLFCNGAETCSPTLGCQAGSDPCPGQACDEGTNTCVACVVNADCDDGLFCNGAETCVGGNCQAGTPPNCNDGIACTADSCNEATDSCDHVPNNALCDDGLFCNGAETCSPTLGCQAGTDPCGGAGCDEANDVCLGAELWLSFKTAATIPGVGTVQDEDIVAYNLGSGTWSWVFDGSDVGLGSFEIDGLAVLAGGDILLSFTAAGTIAGISTDDSDILRFTPTSLGSTTAGTFSMYFDGSDVGLTASGENVDAIGLTAGGNLLISTSGSFSVTGLSGADEDLAEFTATSLGNTTAGSFSMYFDGSDVGLSTTADEDVDGAGLDSAGNILLSTLGLFSVPGVSGNNEDILEFSPTSLGSTTAGTYSLLLDLSVIGIDPTEDVGSLELVE